ncbi:MAG: ATP-binding protein [Dehalococcoidia bacterium]
MTTVIAPDVSAADRPDLTAGDDGFLSMSQAAALLGVSRMTLWRWAKAGRLPMARLGHRTVRISRADLDQLLVETGSRGPTDGSAMPAATYQHAVQFYDRDEFLFDSVSRFLATGLRAGEVAIVVATPTHRAALEDSLRADGLDLSAARAAGRYVALDAAEMLSEFMVAGIPDPTRFDAVIGGLITQAVPNRRVRIFGEMVALLAEAGEHAAALCLEALWNALQQRQAFSLLCGYPLHDFGGADGGDQLEPVCAAHSHVIPTESYTTVVTEADRLTAIVALQQKAQRLEAEIAERQRAEAQLREEHRLIETLYRISATITAELDLTTVVQTVTDAATEVLGAAVGAFYCRVDNEQGESYELQARSGAPEAGLAAVPMPRDTAMFSPTTHVSGAVRLDDVTADARFERTVPRDGLLAGQLPIRSYLAVPVVTRTGEAIGSLCFGHPERGVFGARAERIALGIATHAAIALDHARLFREEKLARDAAQRALHMRDEFLGSISHDLRTPLTSITGLSQLLLRQAGRAPSVESARVTKSLRQVDASAARMAAMIDELLDLTRLESGRPLELNRSRTDAVALIRDIVGQHQRGTGIHRLEIVTELTTAAACWDSARMERALSNLLSNAVKYSPDGGTITVRLSTETTAGQAWLRLTVEDEGMGIPAADLPHIFERFHRAANVQGRIKGIGIGLAGAKQIIEQHGGTVRVESNEGVGTQVTVCMPCEPLAVTGR